MQFLQPGSEGSELVDIPQPFVELSQLANTGHAREAMVELCQGAHSGAGGGHGQAVPVARDGLLATRALLAHKVANTLLLIESSLVERVVHELCLLLGIARQRFGGQHEVS